MLRPTSLFLALILLAGLTPDLSAQSGESESTQSRVGPSGLALPRFVSLRASEVNLRTGPGVQHPIDWVYHRRDLPVQVVDEFETWRKIRDWQGTLGWVHQSMLQGKRTVIVSPAESVLRREPKADSPGVARLGETVIAALKACKVGWCQVEVQGLKGWLRNDEIFGLNSGERKN